MDFVKGGIAANAQFETYNTQLGTLMGSTEGAKERMEELAAFGAATPFELPQLVEAEKVMLGFGLTAGKSMDLAKMSAGDMRTVIGDVAAGTGKDFAEIALTFGKFSAGATGEAISRLQELGVVTREELAAQGVEFSKSGQLMSPLPLAFETATRIAKEKFGGGMDALSNTFEGKMSTLSDTWSQIKRTMTEPLFDAAKAGLDAFLPFLSELATALTNLQSGDYWATFDEIGMAIEKFTGLKVGDWFNDFGSQVQDVADTLKGAFEKGGISGLVASLSELSGFDIAGAFASIKEAALGIGEAIANIDFKAILEKAMAFGKFVGDVLVFIAKNPAIAGIVAAIGGIAVVFGTVMAVIGPFVPIVMSIVGVIGGWVTAAGGLSVVLGTVATVLTGPVALAIAAVVAAFLIWRAKGDEIKAALSAAFEAIKAGITAAWEGIKAAGAAAVAAISAHSNTIKAVILTILTGGLILLYAGWVRYGDQIKAKAAEIVAWIKAKWDDLKAATIAKWEEIKAAIGAAFQAAKDKVIEIATGIGAALSAAWAGITGGAAAAWADLVSLVTGALEVYRSLVQTGLDAVRAAFALAWDTITLLADAAWTTIRAAVQIGIDYIKSVVTAGMQLLSGDWRGAWATLHEAANTAINRVKALVGALAAWLGTLKDSVLQRAMDIGRSIGDGIRTALETGWNLVLDKLRGLVALLPQVVIDMLGIASPSKVFAQLGDWITLGLASGIQKNDQKAVAALADIVGKMSAVANGLADFGKKLAEMIMPTDEQIAQAKSKYLRMTIILTDFIKSVSYLGSLLPVSDVSKAGPGQIKAINAGLTQLSQAFPAIKELQGLQAENLLTGGEASWAGMLADTVGKIAGVWGGIADNMTKMASAKFPTDTQMDALKAAVLRIAVWAQGVLGQASMLSSFGAEEFARAMKAVSDALSTVGGLNLAGIVAVADHQLQTASESIERIGVWARAMVTGWLATGDDTARAKFVANLSEFAGMVKAAADALRAGDIGDLSKLVTVQVPELQILQTNLGRMQQAATLLVENWLKGAGDAAARAQWITDLKDFAATMGAAVEILKLAAIGEVKAELTYNVEAVVKVLEEVRDVLAPALEELVGAWSLGADAAKRSTESMQEFAGWIGAALELAKLSAVGTLKGEIEADVIEIRAVLNWVREHLAPEMQRVADAWKVASEDAARMTEQMQSFGGWIGAALSLAKAAAVGELRGEIEADVIELRAVLNWVRDRLAPEMQASADAWGVASKAAGEMTARMTEFGAWIGAAIGLAKLADVGTLKGDIEADVVELRAVLNWVRERLAPEMQAIADAWGLTAEASKPMIDRMQAFASYIAAAVGLAKAADVGALATVTSPADLGAKLDMVKANIAAVFKMMGEIALTITTEEAKARADLSEALARGMKGLGDFGSGIGSLMDLAQSKLFGSDPTRAGLGHTQRTRGNRADFFAQQLRDTVTRAVQAMQDALAGITIAPNDPKTLAIGQLGDAFGKLASALKELALTKMPDATKLAALVAALNGGGPGGMAFAGAGAGAGGGGGAFRVASVTADTATIQSVSIGAVNVNASMYIDGREIARAVVKVITDDVVVLDDLGKALNERAARRP
ncbi:MAG: hypothetical protein IPK80_02900 [Nannocystis sp.]|nr:hypothetical protein [Nannocystis sp.]